MLDHTAVGIRTQATFGYQQNIVLEPLTPGAPDRRHRRGALPERRGLRHPRVLRRGGDDVELGRRIDVLMASVARIGADREIDLVPTSRYLYEVSAP